ncbi:MAG: hypothetical protein J6Y43_01295, partial [Clostridia bacterium]|nr:hypothetical protein [Clostridia bacterium]
MKAIGEGIITNSTKSQLEKLEQYLEEINTKITLENAKEKFIIRKEDIVRHLKRSIELDPYNLVQRLIKRVILYDDKVEIHYNYINTKSPDDKDRDFLFATKSYSTNGLIFGADSIKIKHITTAFYF